MKLAVVSYKDDYYQNTFKQELYIKSKEKEICVFSVHDLNECPEDAMIGRELFDADELINLLPLLQAPEGFEVNDYEVFDCYEIPDEIWEEIKAWLNS